MSVQRWRSHQIHTPRHVAWSFGVVWILFVQFQDVDVVATVSNGSPSMVVFGSHHSGFGMSIIMSVSVMSMSVMFGSVNSSLTLAGSGRFSCEVCSIDMVLVGDKRSVSQYSLSGLVSDLKYQLFYVANFWRQM